MKCLRKIRCEAYSTYLRTYDLLHAWTIFSDIEKKGCGTEDLLNEMGRILRPICFIIVQDKRSVVEFIKKYLNELHWDSVAEIDFESNPDIKSDEMVFVIQKRLRLLDDNKEMI